MERGFVSPAGHWTWPMPTSQSQAVRCGNLIWVSGQVALAAGAPRPVSNLLSAQITIAIQNLARVLSGAACSLSDVVKLLCFFDAPGPATTDISLPVLVYPGMIIKIDAFAMAEPDKGI